MDLSSSIVSFDYKTIKKIFNNLKKSNIKFILITNSFTKKNFVEIF